MSDLVQIRAELQSLHKKLMEGDPDRRGLEQGIDDWLLAETEFLLSKENLHECSLL